jgi:hypothetical protein
VVVLGSFLSDSFLIKQQFQAVSGSMSSIILCSVTKTLMWTGAVHINVGCNLYHTMGHSYMKKWSNVIAHSASLMPSHSIWSNRKESRGGSECQIFICACTDRSYNQCWPQEQRGLSSTLHKNSAGSWAFPRKFCFSMFGVQFLMLKFTALWFTGFWKHLGFSCWKF